MLLSKRKIEKVKDWRVLFEYHTRREQTTRSTGILYSVYFRSPLDICSLFFLKRFTDPFLDNLSN